MSKRFALSVRACAGRPSGFGGRGQARAQGRACLYRRRRGARRSPPRADRRLVSPGDTAGARDYEGRASGPRHPAQQRRGLLATRVGADPNPGPQRPGAGEPPPRARSRARRNGRRPARDGEAGDARRGRPRTIALGVFEPSRRALWRSSPTSRTAPVERGCRRAGSDRRRRRPRAILRGHGRDPGRARSPPLPDPGRPRPGPGPSRPARVAAGSASGRGFEPQGVGEAWSAPPLGATGCHAGRADPRPRRRAAQEPGDPRGHSRSLRGRGPPAGRRGDRGRRRGHRRHDRLRGRDLHAGCELGGGPDHPPLHGRQRDRRQGRHQPPQGQEHDRGLPPAPGRGLRSGLPRHPAHPRGARAGRTRS